jgi:peptide/nickel transport system ATP-binding protein
MAEDDGAPAPALAVRNLDVAYKVRGADQLALRNVSFEIARGETYGLVGESGSGKSTVALAVVRYLPRNGRVSAGSISVGGRDVLGLNRRGLRALRARDISMVYQEPGRALNPSIRVGPQLTEAIRASNFLPNEAELAVAAEAMLAKVRIPDPRRVMDRYPHELSGGMAQRVVIAMALAATPELLILDEPTTALDATVQAEVLDLLAPLRDELGMSVLFISHNLAVISQMCDRVGVLYAGELVEEGPAAELLAAPRHPYTVGLLRCVPRPGQRKDRGRLDAIPGFLPQPGDKAPGCVFAPRCGLAIDECRSAPPPLFDVGTGRVSRCYRHDQAQDLPFTASSPGDNPPVNTSSPRSGGPVPPVTSRAPSAAPRQQSSPAPPASSSHPTIPPPASPPARPARTAQAAAERNGNEGIVTDGGPEGLLLSVEGVSKTFHARGGSVRALRDVSVSLRAGQTLGLVGESGSGKTTLARILLGLTAPDPGGRVALDGAQLPATLDKRPLATLRDVQIVFQNPDSALNRRATVRSLISRPLARLAGLSGPALAARLTELVSSVRLAERHLPLRPGQLSGGLKQRVAIARAFAAGPRIVVCDEPTSALDVSVQAAILNLLGDLQAERRTSYVFISHDLEIVRYLSDQIVVLYAGRVLESGPASAVFSAPHHPYTEALLSAMPALPSPALPSPALPSADPPAPGGPGGEPTGTRIRLAGEPPSLTDAVSGCIFHTRCPRKLSSGICETTEPDLLEGEPGHLIRCHIPISELRHLQGRQGVPAELSPRRGHP